VGTAHATYLKGCQGVVEYIATKTSGKEVAAVKYTRITVEPDKMGGMPCIRGLRIPLATVVGMIADGMSEQDILKAYPDLEPEDIRQTLQYAAEALTERELPLVSAP
jgi:uncharacterized protein (DUF433 family)